jgi:hypothetical protein
MTCFYTSHTIYPRLSKLVSESFKPDEVKNELWQNDDKIDLFMPSLCFYPTARKDGDQSMAVDDTLS